MHVLQAQNGFFFHLRSLLFLTVTLTVLFGYSSVTQAEAKPKAKPAPNDPTLLVLGDSLSAAYGMPVEKGWVALLTQDLKNRNIQVVNASISGETTSGGKSRLPALLKQHQPDWVILELGANDALRGQVLQTTERNLQQMVDMSRQAGAEVLLLGIRLPTNYGPAYDALLQKTFQQVAERNQLLFDPFFLETVVMDPDMAQDDGLHPNAQAQPAILKRVQPLIEQLITQKPAKAA